MPTRFDIFTAVLEMATLNLRRPLPEDPYIAVYNTLLEKDPLMQQYRDSLNNGSISAAQGPPLRSLKSVPQSVYTGNSKAPDTICDLNSPIQFLLDASLSSGDTKYKGLVLAEALHEKPIGIYGAATRVSLGYRTKISLRLRVDGYKDCGDQMPACRATPDREGKELAEIAQKVAAFVHDSMPLVQLDGAEVRQWRLPNGDKVAFEDLILLELRHVSTGSWQPALAYFR